jgi:hypothetical protein
MQFTAALELSDPRDVTTMYNFVSKLITYRTEKSCVSFQPNLKGTVARFSTSGFFHQSTPPRALTHGLKPFRIWLRIRRDNRFESRENRFQRCQ